MVGLNLTTSVLPRTLAQILATPDAAVSWKWGVMIPDTLPRPIEGRGNMEPKSNFFVRALKTAWNGVMALPRFLEDQVGAASIGLRAKSIQVPFEEISSTTVRTQARLRNFPDQVKAGNLSITFYEDYNYTALTYFERWKKSIVNEYGVFRLPGGDDGYARNIYAFMFDTVGLLKGIVTFENCYPQQINPLEFGNSSSAIELTCEFSVQAISWTPMPLLNGGAIGSIGKTIASGVMSDNYKNTIESGISGVGSIFKNNRGWFDN